MWIKRIIKKITYRTISRWTCATENRAHIKMVYVNRTRRSSFIGAGEITKRKNKTSIIKNLIEGIQQILLI